MLYRGMSTEWAWNPKPDRTFSSWTFSRVVGESFADMNKKSRYKHATMVKRTFPVEKLFMTFLETREMNTQYKEAEALVITEEKDRLLS